MQIDFYEEFPNECLDKIKLINWNCRVFIAARSVEDFKNIKKLAKKLSENEMENAAGKKARRMMISLKISKDLKTTADNKYQLILGYS